jgi:hypothetical protein
VRSDSVFILFPILECDSSCDSVTHLVIKRTISKRNMIGSDK